jgi:putative membrane-bound dehydrogenase-like protein
MTNILLPCLLTCGIGAGIVNATEPEPHVQTTQPGVRLSLVAEQPALVTPTGLDVDDQGRVWVVATHTHFRPEDYTGPTHDEILVFDTAKKDGDKLRRTVFYNATTATMDLELGKDGWVYLAERDRILRIKDTDGDGVADTEQDLIVLNSEADYPHNGLSGLAWHPNGDLVFGLGENFAKPWTLTASDGGAVTGAGQGGIFRCTADGTNLRWLARGLWNPFGACVRDDGEIFAAENDPGERPPCRLLHIVDGGEYGYRRQYGPEAHHPFVCWNGELTGTLPMVHPTGEAPCGIVPLGRGLLVPSWGDHRIDFMPLTRHGASYTAKQITIVKGGRYFRPACIARAPSSDAADAEYQTWFLTDWVDGRYDAHGFGRLWKLEIDLRQAAHWLGPLDLEPPNEAAKLAARLRGEGQSFDRSQSKQHASDDNPALAEPVAHGEGQSFDRSQLIQHASDDDPFVARAALVALSRTVANWDVDDVSHWSADERAHAARALSLARASADKWLPALLADDSTDVQFEALKWIANAELKQFLPNVEAMLHRSDASYQLFEAGLATWNTLNGQSEAGVRNLEMLLARVQDRDSSPRLRAYALRLLPSAPQPAQDGISLVRKFPKGLTIELLEELLQVNDATLSLEVVRTLAANAPASQALLTAIAVDPDRDENLRAEAVAGLAAVAEQHLDLLFQLAADIQRSVREEALRCLRLQHLSDQQIAGLRQIETQYPESADLIQAVLDPSSLKTDRPPVTDTQAWLQLLEKIESPADPNSGRRLFHHTRVTSCANCHRHDGRGNVVGPDLTSLGKRNDDAWLLKSILTPSADMAPEFQPRTIVLKDGRSFTGIRLRSYTKEQIRDANGLTQTFEKGDVEAIVDSHVSFMPNGLADTLTNRELRDLIAFLQNRPDDRVAGHEPSSTVAEPLVRVVDLDVGETRPSN